MEELVDLVLSLNEQIKEKLPNINAGGCGVFALIVAKQLQLLGYEPKINILINKYEAKVGDKKEVLNNIRNGNKVAYGAKGDTSFAHCYVEVSGLVFDGIYIGNSFREKWNYLKTDGYYTLEELSLALKVGNWNSTYSRQAYNPKLRRVIKQSIKKVFHVEHDRLSYSL